MAVDPSISLGVKPFVAPDPLEQYKGLMSLQNLMGEQALRRQQIQTGIQTAANVAAEAKQKQLDQQDQNQLQNYWQDPKFQTAYGSGDTEALSSMLGGKLQSKTIQNVIANATTQATAHNTLGEAQRTNKEKFAGQVGNIVNAVNSTENDEQAASIAKQGLQGLHSDPDFATMGTNLPDPSTVTPSTVRDLAKNAGAYYNITQATIDKAQALREAKAKADKETALAANAQAETPGIKATSDVKVAQAVPEEAIAKATAADPNLLSPAEREKANEALITQKYEKGRLGVEQQNASINAKKFDMEFGPGTVESLAHQVLDNPDASARVPAALIPAVTKSLHDRGYTFPKPAQGTSVTQEQAARNTFSALDDVQRLLADPEVATRRGAILGRVGEAEQDIGATAGMTPEGAKKAQDLRTTLRYLFTQELKANLSGRPAERLAQTLQTASPSANMSDPLIQGAMKAVKDSAGRITDAVDAERFGGKARPRTLRNVPTDIRVLNGRRIASDDGGKTIYDATTGDPIR
jgi:hypothetical protein